MRLPLPVQYMKWEEKKVNKMKPLKVYNFIKTIVQPTSLSSYLITGGHFQSCSFITATLLLPHSTVPVLLLTLLKAFFLFLSIFIWTFDFIISDALRYTMFICYSALPCSHVYIHISWPCYVQANHKMISKTWIEIKFCSLFCFLFFCLFMKNFSI